VSRLLTDYVDYLLAGGQPIEPPDPSPLTGAHLARLAEDGRAFDWLDDEPDLYSPDHGEPV
jgi:hypothetical protein